MSQSLICPNDATRYVKSAGLGSLAALRVELRLRKIVLTGGTLQLFRYEPMGSVTMVPSGRTINFDSFKGGETASDVLVFADPNFNALRRRDEFLLRFQFDPTVPRYTLEVWDLTGGDYLLKTITAGVTATGLTITDFFALANSGYGSNPLPAEADFCRVYSTNVALGSAPPALTSPGTAAPHAWEFEGVLTDAGSSPLAMVAQGGFTPTYGTQEEPPTMAPVLSSATYATAPDRVNLVFTDPNSGSNEEQFVDVERRVGTTGDWKRIGFTVAPDLTAFPDNLILHGTTYNYRVKARNRLGSTAYSNIVSASTSAGTDTNPTITENAKAGVAAGAWKLTNPATAREIEGYCDVPSANRGGTINFKVSSTGGQNFNLDIFRMGWYGGSRARLIKSVASITGVAQTMPTETNPSTNRYVYECAWSTSYALSLTDADPTEWPSGIYLARATRVTDGKQCYMVFCVRDDTRRSALYYNQPINTYTAYNAWPHLASDALNTGGGRGMYPFASSGLTAEASFNRPYMITPRAEGAFAIGSGELLAINAPNTSYATRSLRTASSEINWLFFLEKNGYDVQYGTDHDLHTQQAALWGRCVGLLFPGHQEYWTLEMRDTVIAARDYGRNLAFLGANAAYWQVRLAASPGSGAINRAMIAYKALGGDPITATDPRRETTTWRTLGTTPVPEASFIGVQYSNDPSGDQPYTFQGAIITHPIGIGTGLTVGQTVPGLVGYEWDEMYASSPAGTVLLSRTSWAALSGGGGSVPAGQSDMTVYAAASGAEVFATGSMQAIWAADDYGAAAPESLRPSYLHTAVATMLGNVVTRQAIPTISEAGTGGGGGVATHLAVTTQPTSLIASGGVHATQPVVAVEDASNAVVPGDTSVVTAALVVETGSATPRGTLTKVAVAGVADFAANGLGGNNTGAGVATAHWHFDDGSLTGVDSATFSIAVPVTAPAGQLLQYLTFFLDDTHTVDGAVVVGVPTVAQTTVSTDPIHNRPWMMAIEEGVDTRVDLVEAAVAIGALTLRVQDTRRLASQDTGWFTYFLADIGGKSALIGQRVDFKQIDQFGTEYNVSLLIQDIELEDNFTVYKIPTRDMRERERTLALFYASDEAVVWPINWPDKTGVLGIGSKSGYGYFKAWPGGSTGSDRLVPPSKGVMATWRLNTVDTTVPWGSFVFNDQPWVDATPAGPQDWATLFGRYNQIDGYGDTDFTVPPTAQGSLKSLNHLTGMMVQWRVWGSTGAWNELRNAPIWMTAAAGSNFTDAFTFYPGFYYFKSKSNSKGLQYELSALKIGWHDFSLLPANGTVVEVRVISELPPSEKDPLFVELTFGAFLKKCYDGDYSLKLPGGTPGVRYNATLMAALATSTPYMRLIKTNLEKEGLRWLQENWYKPMRMIPIINEAGEIEPTSYDLPDASVALTTLDQTNVAKATWKHGSNDAITGVEFTYKRDYIAQDKSLQSIDVVAARIDAPGTVRIGDKVVKFAPETVRDVSSDITKTYGKAEVSEFGYYLFKQISTALIDRFSLGGQHLMVQALRTDPAVRALKGGMWCQVTIPWLPDYVTKQRGLNRLMQVVYAKDLNPTTRDLELVDAGPYNTPAAIPIVGNLTATVDANGIKVVAAKTPANQYLRVDVANAATLPGPAEPAWMMIGRVRGGQNNFAWSDDLSAARAAFWGQSTTNVLSGLGLNGHTAVQISDTSSTVFQLTSQNVSTVADGNPHTVVGLILKDTDVSRVPIIRLQVTGGTPQGIDVAFNTMTGQFSVQNMLAGTAYLATVTLSPDNRFWVVRLTVWNNGTNTAIQTNIYPAVGVGGAIPTTYAVAATGGITVARMILVRNSDSIPAELYDAAYGTNATPVLTAVVKSRELAPGLTWVRARYEQEGRRPSGWLQVASLTIVGTLMSSITATIDPLGFPQLLWTPVTAIGGLRIYYAVVAPGVATPTLTTFIDVDASLGSVGLPVQVPQFSRVAITAYAYPGFSSGAVTGTVGLNRMLPETTRIDDNVVIPTASVVATETAVLGTLALTLNDPQWRTTRVQMATASGNGSMSAYADVLAVAGVYTGTVPLIEKQPSKIAWRLYGLIGSTETLLDGDVVRYAIGGIPLPPEVSYQIDGAGMLSVLVKGDSSTTNNRVVISTDAPPSDVQVDAAPLLVGRNASVTVQLNTGQRFYIGAKSYNAALGGTTASQGSPLVPQADQWVGASASGATVSVGFSSASPTTITLAGILFGALTTHINVYVREYRTDPGGVASVVGAGYRLGPARVTNAPIIIPVANPTNYIVVSLEAVDSLNRVGGTAAYGLNQSAGVITLKIQAAATAGLGPNAFGTPNIIGSANGSVSFGLLMPATNVPATIRVWRNSVLIQEIPAAAASTYLFITDTVPLGTYNYIFAGVSATGDLGPLVLYTYLFAGGTLPAPTAFVVSAWSSIKRGFDLTITPPAGLPGGARWVISHSLDGIGWTPIGYYAVTVTSIFHAHDVDGTAHNHYMMVFASADGWTDSASLVDGGGVSPGSNKPIPATA